MTPFSTVTDFHPIMVMNKSAPLDVNLENMYVDAQEYNTLLHKPEIS
jgi:hypothetical protein